MDEAMDVTSDRLLLSLPRDWGNGVHRKKTRDSPEVEERSCKVIDVIALAPRSPISPAILVEVA